MTTRELVEKLFEIDYANSDEIPVQSNGLKAYQGWVKSSGEAGDYEISSELAAIDESEFAAEWESLYSFEYNDEINGRR